MLSIQRNTTGAYIPGNIKMVIPPLEIIKYSSYTLNELIDIFNQYEQDNFNDYDTAYDQDSIVDFKYGQQDIYRQESNIAIDTIRKLYINGFNIFVILIYAGFRRYLLSVRRLEEYPNMGKWRPVIKSHQTLTTPLKGERFRLAKELIYQLPESETVIFQGTIMKVMHTENYTNVEYILDDENKSTLIYNNQANIDLCMDKSLEIPSPYSCAGFSENITIKPNYYANLMFQDMTLDDIARLHWHLCVKVPHIRGGGTIAEWICASLISDFKGWNTEVWNHAITSGIDKFVKDYQYMFH